MERVLFIDKDDTIVIDAVYNPDFKDQIFFKDAINLLKYASKKNYFIFIISNQSGIGRKFYSEEFYLKNMRKLIRFLKEKGINIIDHEYCPSLPVYNSLCRKPKPGMIKILQSYYNFKLKNTIFIGDRATDVELALNLKIKPVFIYRRKLNINDLLFVNKKNNFNIDKLLNDYNKRINENFKKLKERAYIDKIIIINNLEDLKNFI